MRTATKLAAVVILLVAGAPCAATNPAPTVTVYPTGAFPTDVLAVQAAVDQGGVVLLKATNASGRPAAFNFGPALPAGGFVLLTADVSVLGETTGGAMTTVSGGYLPFVGFGAPVRSAFRGINFTGPYGAAVILYDSAGFDFRECRISGVVGLPWVIPDLGFPPGTTKGQGLWIGPTGDPERVTGPILIEDNSIEDIQATLGYGMALVTFSGDMRVARNTIKGTATAGIFLYFIAGAADVEDNYVAPGPSRYPGTAIDYGNGIWLNLPISGGTAYIRRNEVVCENPQADGIILLGSNSLGFPAPVQNTVVEKNRVTMVNTLFGGISLYGAVQDSHVGQNEILGSAAFALPIFGFLPEDKAVSNAYAGNNVSHFQSSIADVFFDQNTEDNTLVGHSGSVIDLGNGNRITGYTKGGPGAKLGHFRNALAAKLQVLQSLKEIERNAFPF
jgi:hypothetical protein